MWRCVSLYTPLHEHYAKGSSMTNDVRESMDSADSSAPLEDGSVLMCLDCDRRILITPGWLEEARKRLNHSDLGQILPRLRCFCGARARAQVCRPRSTREDFLKALYLLRQGKSDVRTFIQEMQNLASENNLLAKQWLEKSSVPVLIEREDARSRQSARSRRNGNYNTKQWVDWELGISSRQGRRNRMYE